MAWDGGALRPIWEQVHSRELYNHAQACDKGTIVDCHDYKNEAMDAPPSQLSELSVTLREAYGFAA